MFISNFFPKNIESPWVYVSSIALCLIFIGLCFRELSQKVILTVSEKGITYSGNDYIFAPKLESIRSEQLSKILIADFKPLDFEERFLTPKICLFDQQGRIIKDLDIKKWDSLDHLSLAEAFKSSLKDKVELANRTMILEVIRKHQKEVIQSTELGRVAGYFAYASVGLMLICGGLAFLDPFITIEWGAV